MKKDVMINIRSRQTLAGQRMESGELSSVGRLVSRGPNGWLLSYTESEVTGMEGTRSTFRIEPDRVALSRTGSVTAQMIFQVGRTHTSIYSTPYGALEIGVTARRIENTLTEAGGRLVIEYTLDIGHVLSGVYCIQIDVAELQAGARPLPADRPQWRVPGPDLRQ